VNSRSFEITSFLVSLHLCVRHCQDVVCIFNVFLVLPVSQDVFDAEPSLNFQILGSVGTSVAYSVT
jgi:hypothetical protein